MKKWGTNAAGKESSCSFIEENMFAGDGKTVWMIVLRHQCEAELQFNEAIDRHRNTVDEANSNSPF